MVGLAWDLGVDIEVFVFLDGVVPDQEIPRWVAAIEQNNMLDLGDIRVFVEAGLAPEEVWSAADGLTASETVKYLKGEYEFLSDIEDEQADFETDDEDEDGSFQDLFCR